MSWLQGWQYRKSHEIQGSTAGAQTDYQVKIVAHYGSEKFSFGAVTNVKADHAHQGITTDGTYVYTTDDSHIYKYRKDGTLVDSRDTSGDGTYGSHNGDLCYVDGKLYVVTCNYPNTPKAAAIAVYDASDLSFIGECVLSNPPDYGAGISYHDGKFWVIFDNPSNKVIWKMTQTDTTTFTKDAEYPLTYEISGGHGYQGCDWYKDYLFCNIHENSSPSTCDVYHWNGTGFDEFQRIDQPSWSGTWGGTAKASQGLAIENDGGTYYVWWASRGNDPDNDFAKTKLILGDWGENVCLNEKCRSDFGDIRFTDSDGTTELDYWMEDKVDGDYAIFWVKVPNIPAYPDTTTIYIYYGNPSATTKSNGADTFIVFDDFEDTDFSDWKSMGASAVMSQAVVDGRKVLKIDRQTTSGANAWKYKGAFSSLTSYVVECLEKDEDTSYNVAAGLAFAIDTANTRSYAVNLEGTSSYGKQYISKYYGDAGYDHFVSAIISLAKNAWYKHQAIVNGDTITYKVYDLSGNLRLSISGSDTEYPKTGFFGIRIWRSYSYFDDFRVRKYVDPEPSHGDWGSEETLSKKPTNLILTVTPL